MAVRKSRLILLAALFVIFLITVFAFVWVDGGFGGGEVQEYDEYGYYERFPDPEAIEIDLKMLPKNWPSEGVDLIYLWTRPISEGRFEEYQTYYRTVMSDADLIVEEMPVDFAQMQHYFARGIDRFAPWVKNLYIVIPDSIDNVPFNRNNKRIKVIKHSEIASKSMLPMFNPRAILLNLLANYEDISSQFVLADDMTYPISYMSPTDHRSRKGIIRLPIVHPTASMPLQDAEAKIILSTAKEVKKALLQQKERLGFSDDEIEHMADIQNLPKFEHRGWQFLDKDIIDDLRELMQESLSRTQHHRLLRNSSVDVVYMHHVYMYWMNKLYQNSRHARKFVKSYDSNSDGILDRGEATNLAHGLGYEYKYATEWVQSLLNTASTINLKTYFEHPKSGFLDIIPLAVEPKFRISLVENRTVALELRHKIPVRLSVVMPILKSGRPAVLWAGPRLLGPSGSDAKEVVEEFLWTILHRTASPLEAIYKPNPSLGLWIGIFYFVFFFGGAYVISKVLLAGSTRKRTSD